MKNLLFFVGILFSLISIISCEQSDPSETGVRIEDSLVFSGFKWGIKSSEAPVGPGYNKFSNRTEDIWIDSKERLHMKIANHSSGWYSTEVITKELVGYGTYTFTVLGDLKNIPTNVVLGLFTWDTETFQTDANSEVDIEFSYWGNDTLSSSLTYSVQPVSFGSYNAERTNHPQFDGEILNGKSTHIFTWTEDLISWESYTGGADNLGDKIASWSFDKNNPGKVKVEGTRISNKVVIPKPGDNTNIRINLWIGDWQGQGPEGFFPLDLQEREIIIETVAYEPLN
jgi:hypothetical protein